MFLPSKAAMQQQISFPECGTFLTSSVVFAVESICRPVYGAQPANSAAAATATGANFSQGLSP